MPGRVLTAARVRVPAGAESEFLALAGSLAVRLAESGWRVWVFRRRDAPDQLLEFRERRAGPVGKGDPEAERLDRRMRELARYREDDILWDEVQLPSARET